MRWREGNGSVGKGNDVHACKCVRILRARLFPALLWQTALVFLWSSVIHQFTSRKIHCSSRPCPLSTLSLKLCSEGNRWEREGNPPLSAIRTYKRERDINWERVCVCDETVESVSVCLFLLPKIRIIQDFSWMCQLEYLWPEIPNLSRSFSFGRSAADWSDNILPGFQGYTQTPPPSLSPPTHLYTHREREGTPSLPRSHTCTHERETYTENVCVCVMWV